MPSLTDAQLLRDYTRTGSEHAFGELVSRYTNLVYSAALRQTTAPEAAREITQDVFTDLARKAPTLAATLHDDATLGGWLYKSARYATLNALRDERRRVAREQKLMHEVDSTPDPDEWARVAPVLDEAMAELNDTEREAVVLRYFQNLDFQSVGRALGVSDDTAQKRVSRAVEHLRELLAKRGVAVGGSGLAILISTNAVLVAPVGLSAAIITSAVTGTAITTTATTTAAVVTKTIAMTSLQKTFVAAVLTAAISTGIFEMRRASALQDQVRAFEKMQAEQIQDRQREHEEATDRLTALKDEMARLNGNLPELLRLRAQVGNLRQRLDDAQRRNPDRAADLKDAAKRWAFGEIKPVTDWQNAGLGSPLAAMETFWWAAANSNYEGMKQAIVFDQWTNSTPASELYARREAQFNAGFLQGLQNAGLSIVSLNRAQMPADRAVIQVELSGLRPKEDGTLIDVMHKEEFKLLNVNGEWKIGREEKLMRVNLFEDDSEMVAKIMLGADPKFLEKLVADPRLPRRTLQAYEALKAKSAP